MLKEEKLEKLTKLINNFKANYNDYRSSNYNEEKTKIDFIDKFFALLDWDMNNEQGYSEIYRDVLREDTVYIKGSAKAPDYTFKIGKENSLLKQKNQQ